MVELFVHILGGDGTVIPYLTEHRLEVDRRELVQTKFHDGGLGEHAGEGEHHLTYTEVLNHGGDSGRGGDGRLGCHTVLVKTIGDDVGALGNGSHTGHVLETGIQGIRQLPHLLLEFLNQGLHPLSRSVNRLLDVLRRVMYLVIYLGLLVCDVLSRLLQRRGGVVAEHLEPVPGPFHNDLGGVVYVLRRVRLSKYIGRSLRDGAGETDDSGGQSACGVDGRACQFGQQVHGILAETIGLIDCVLTVHIQPVHDAGHRTGDTVHLGHQVIGGDVYITVQQFIHLVRQFLQLRRQINHITYNPYYEIFGFRHQRDELRGLKSDRHRLDAFSHSSIDDFHTLTPFIPYKQLVLGVIHNQSVVGVIDDILTQYELVEVFLAQLTPYPEVSEMQIAA